MSELNYVVKHEDGIVTDLSNKRLHEEVEKLFIKNIEMIMNGLYIPMHQRGKGTYHSVNDLPGLIDD